jgi:hypothetical protein
MFCEECGTSLIGQPEPLQVASQSERQRTGFPVWLKAVTRFALSCAGGYVMGKLSMLVLNLLLQVFG